MINIIDLIVYSRPVQSVSFIDDILDIHINYFIIYSWLCYYWIINV